MATSTSPDGSLSSLGLTPEVWQRLSPLLDAAMERPPSAREVWLQGLPPEHDELRPLLARLLAQRGGAPLTLPSLDEPEDDDRRAGDTVGPYRLLRPLGQGGMGTVWLAQRTDGGLQRPVALKLPRLEGPSRQRLAERLARERDLLATLSHPNIAQLHDAGLTEQGQPYLALEWVSGERIDLWCGRQQLDTAARVRLFLQVAQAVAHAHARLIVHRDLKPSNLLVDEQGQVKLLDFGIAKLLDEGPPADSTLTREHARPLTPDYASPEQLSGAALDTRSDIYTLGVVLYELLCGHRPYRVAGTSWPTGSPAVMHEVPLAPSQVATVPDTRRRLRGDLDTIVLKALKKLPAERYPTVEALADDLQRHLDRRPVLARPDSLGYVLRRLMVRHRTAVAAGALALLAVLVGAGAAAWQAQRAEGERRRADEVKEFVAHLLRDASPFRPAATSWRTQRMVSQGLRQSSGGVEGGGEAPRDAAAVAALAVLQQAAAQLDRGGFSDAAVRAELERLVGEGLLSFAAWGESGRRLGAALEQARQQLGDEHAQTLRLRLALVQHGRLTGRAAQAAADLAALLPLLRRGLGHSAEALVQALQLAALLELDRAPPARSGDLAALRRVDALVVEAERAGAALMKSSPEHVSLALLRSLLLRVSGEADQARQAATRALAALPDPATEPAPGARRALRVEARHLLARALLDAGHRAAALREFEQAAAEARPLMRNDRLPLALLLHSAHGVALELNDLNRAAGHAEDLAALAAQGGRAEAFLVALADSARGSLQMARGDAVAALTALEAALAHWVVTLGPQHELTLGVQLQRLRALASSGDLVRGRQAILNWPEPVGDTPERQRLRQRLHDAALPFR